MFKQIKKWWNTRIVVSKNGDKNWYLHGKLHREDGPAVEFANGHTYWFLNGEELTEKQFLEKNNGRSTRS